MIMKPNMKHNIDFIEAHWELDSVSLIDRMIEEAAEFEVGMAAILRIKAAG